MPARMPASTAAIAFPAHREEVPPEGRVWPQHPDQDARGGHRKMITGSGTPQILSLTEDREPLPAAGSVRTLSSPC